MAIWKILFLLIGVTGFEICPHGNPSLPSHGNAGLASHGSPSVASHGNLSLAIHGNPSLPYIHGNPSLPYMTIFMKIQKFPSTLMIPSCGAELIQL